jgi:hypothetical protein
MVSAFIQHPFKHRSRYIILVLVKEIQLKGTFFSKLVVYND